MPFLWERGHGAQEDDQAHHLRGEEVGHERIDRDEAPRLQPEPAAEEDEQAYWGGVARRV